MKLRELQRLFLVEAVKYNALRLDGRLFERFNQDLAGRPQLIKGATRRSPADQPAHQGIDDQ